METYLALDKGLHTDFEPLNQPAGSYRYMLNSIRQLSGAIENERGTVLRKSFLPTQKIIGSYVLDTDFIFCLASTNVAESEIGILDASLTYTQIRRNADLNFKLGSIVKIEGKKNYKGQRIISMVEKNGDNPMRTINLDDVNLLASPTFADDIKLQINPDTPTISIDSVVDGGSLPTGVYQATARLLTRSTNPTPFGIISPLVSVIDDSSNLDINQQDGANPQSNSPKAINFLIKGIDTSYAFIEVAIITYTGTANVTSAHLIARLPIDGRNQILFTYSSTDQNKEPVDLEAIAIKPVLYDKAETIAQKDGILTLGNLTATSEDYDFQQVANLVKVKYFIEEVPYLPGYKDPINAATKKGYQRDEVYSFAITPEFKGQYNTTAYHIPGNSLSSTVNTTTKILGGYQSLEQYPLGKNYPTGSVYHHRMPTINQEPIIVVRDGQTYLRVLGIECDFSLAIGIIPQDVLKKIKGFSIVRQIRKDNDKSILTQGIANTHFKDDHLNYRWEAPVPKFTANTHFMFNTVPITNEVGFYSPETVIYQTPIVGNITIKRVAQLEGTQRLVNHINGHDNDGGVPANFQIILDYDNVVSTTQSDKLIVPNSVQYINEDSANSAGSNNTNVLINGTNDTINNYKNNGYLYFKLFDPLTNPSTSYNTTDGKFMDVPEIFYGYKALLAGFDLVYLRGVPVTQSQSSLADRYLYNIVRQLDRQYGAIFDATYIYCGSYSIDNNNLVGRVFGGDIFINKFGVVATGAMNTEEDEIMYKILSYYFCESTINTAYRHYSNPIGTENQSGFIPGTTPYYPKLSVLYNDPNDQALTPGILNLSWSLGHGRGYNKQYSFENTIIVYYPKQLAEDPITKYANRVIYSEFGVEGEQVDSWRIFLPNNYHDIPKDKGEITELFVHNHRYYIHTSGALYLASFNDRVMMNNSIGESYLGNGGVFNRPSEPILTMNGGYAGTTSSCGINTPFGRLFTDNLNGKIYLLGESLKEISEQGMLKYFGREIKDIADTPSLDSGYVTAYDDYNKRILLTKIGDEGWTLSYSPQLNSWSSYHSYTPYHYLTRNQEMYSVINNEVWQHLVGDYSIFYGGLPSPMQLDIVINDAPNTTKTFDNLVFYTTSQNADEIEQHYDTWNTLWCYNTTRNSGKCRLVVPRNFQDDFRTLGLFEVFAKLKSNEFRVAIPNDLVIDINQSIFTATNLTNSRNYRPSMSGKWLLVSLQYNNLRNNRFVLHTIGRIFRHRIR